MSSAVDSSDGGRSPAREEKRTAAAEPSDSSKKSKLSDKIPDWVTDNLRTPRTWKTFVRCMIAFFATLVLLLVDDSLQTIGQAAFFSLITAVMLPPSMALSIFIFAMLTLVVGMCLGWAWGCAAMAAGLRARDQVLLARQVQTAQHSSQTNANPDAQYQLAIFHGDFLDPRSSAVYGVFLFVGAWLLGFLRAHKPRLTLMCVFGTIILDLMCSYGPLFPIAQYTLARQLLVPAAIYIAIACAATVLIFPQSLNHMVITDLIKTNLRPVQSLLRLQNDVLACTPSDYDSVEGLSKKAVGLRMAHVMGVTAVEGQIGMLQLEITRGQIGPVDLAKIFEKAKELGTRAYGLASFILVLEQGHRSLKEFEGEENKTSVRTRKRIELMRRDRHPRTSLDELMPQVEESTRDLRNAADAALEDAIKWLDTVNHSRWRKAPAGSLTMAEREKNLADLQEALAEFRTSKHFTLLEPYRELFDAQGNLRPGHEHIVRSSVPTLFRCHVFTSNLISFSIILVELLELLLRIERENPKARIQLPTAFAKMLMHSANDSSTGGNPLDLGTTDDDDVDRHSPSSSSETLVEGKNAKKEKKAKVYPRDPDADTPHNALQKFGRAISAVGRVLSSPQGLFALKYGIVSVALWIPQVVPSSAYFVYTNRGLWALIMSQTGLGVFAGEQIAAFVVRMGGTLLGLVIGMVAWYIGAPGTATGTGTSPYGIAATTMVFMAPFIFMRIIAPIQAMPFWLMTGVTIVFVIGYSWVDEHVYQIANQGSGAALAGRRALLVIIGFTAAFIVMLFPKPLSARQIVRRNIAKNIASTSDLYVKVLGGVEEEAESNQQTEGVDAKGRIDKVRGPFLKILGRMPNVHQQMSFATFEPGLKGPWPKKKYEALVETQGSLVSSLALLAGAYSRLQPVWCRRLERSDHLHPTFVADCLALFSLLHQSLRNGQPMPATMPIFERLAYHSSHRHFPGSTPSTQSKVDGEGKRGDVADSSDSDAGSELGLEGTEDNRALKLIDQPLTWDLCHDEQLSIFATATVALTHVAHGLNELQKIVISLVGENEAGHFERAQQRWAEYETKV